MVVVASALNTPHDAVASDTDVVVYGFRLCVTANPANRVPFPEPANYDPARFEAVRRYFAVGKPDLPWDLYPIPGGKADANNGIGKQFSMGLIGGGNDWCEADAAGRQRIWEAHKQYTLQLYRFFTTDRPAAGPARRRTPVRRSCSTDATIPNKACRSPGREPCVERAGAGGYARSFGSPPNRTTYWSVDGA